MKNQRLNMMAVIVGLAVVGTAYKHMQRRRRDKIASELLREISRIIKPATEGLISENAFDIYYAEEVLKKINAQVLVLKKEVAIRWAKEIHAAWGAWYEGGDDENKVYGVFRSLKDKVQVSQVARAYQELYGENLVDKLYDKFDESEIKKVLGIVRGLPAYRTI